MHQNFIVFFVILAACASIGSTLQCYECSHLDQYTSAFCRDPFEQKAPIKMCNPGEVCGKQSSPGVKIGNQVSTTLVARGCAPQAICSKIPSEFREYCHTCTSNMCNLSVTIFPSVSTVFCLYIIKVIFL